MLGHALEQDSNAGPETLAAMNACDASRLLAEYARLADGYYNAMVRCRILLTKASLMDGRIELRRGITPVAPGMGDRPCAPITRRCDPSVIQATSAG